MAHDYLVLFVADVAHDGHADALRSAARAVPGAGFFDDGAGGPDRDERTVGTYVRAGEPQDGLALLRAVAVVSHGLQARFEVQHAEQILGYLDAGRPDAALLAEVGPLGDIPDPL
ncbi:MAG TPA: hypothetical protein VNT03_13600 [Baekduia sp.]|nr:hypothetical protein [Baekduia sp.]